MYKKNKELRDSKFVGKVGEFIQEELQVLKKEFYLDTKKYFYVLKDRHNNIYVYHQFIPKEYKILLKKDRPKLKRWMFPWKRSIYDSVRKIHYTQKWGHMVNLRPLDKYFFGFTVLKHHEHEHKYVKGLKIKQTVIKNVFTYTSDYKKKILLDEIEKL
jgi:hypothetical protein